MIEEEKKGSVCFGRMKLLNCNFLCLIIITANMHRRAQRCDTHSTCVCGILGRVVVVWWLSPASTKNVSWHGWAKGIRESNREVWRVAWPRKETIGQRCFKGAPILLSTDSVSAELG